MEGAKMSWMLPRVLVAVLVALGGAWLGRQFGLLWSLPWLGALLGLGLVVAAVCAWDAWRGARLLTWLSSDMSGPAPGVLGFWGEAGARVERALRSRERETAQERARLSDFLDAIEASPNGVLLLDAHDQIVWCSRIAAEHLSLDPVRDRLQPVTNLVRAPAFVAHLQGRQHGSPVQIPTRGGQGVLSIQLRAYGDGQRLMITQDITDRERADATRRDFVANVSHEIRTPLTVLSGFVETMSNLPLTEVERQRVLVLMTQQTRRMQTLVGDLLLLARLEGSPRPAHDSWLPLARLGAAVATEAEALSHGQHELAFDWGGDWELAGNEAELQSAIANLVANAVRYTPARGRIQVRAARRDDGGLALSVEDTGPGIAAEHLPRLTERFYRVDTSRSRDTGGTGLGLAIVKHVAQRHGGSLQIRSVVGQGSCFTLCLPAMRVRSPGQHATGKVAQPAGVGASSAP